MDEPTQPKARRLRTAYSAKDTEPLPPWDERRDSLRTDEAAAWLRKLYNLPTSKDGIVKWIKQGKWGESGERVYLKARKMQGAWYVKKTDLIAYLEA